MKNLTNKIRGPIGPIWIESCQIDRDIEDAGFPWSQVFNEVARSTWAKAYSQNSHDIHYEIKDQIEH